MLTLQDYENHMMHAIGGMPDSRITLVQTANEALSYLFLAYDWNWRSRPPLDITTQPAPTPASGNITAIARADNLVTVTLDAAPVPALTAGEQFTIAGVTDMTFNGAYEVSTVLSTSSFTFIQDGPDSTSTGGTAIATAPDTFLNYLALPADFGEIIAVNRPNREVQLTSLQDLVHRRHLTLVPPPIASVFAALSYPAQADQSSEAPVPRLEMFPTPTGTDMYTLTYRAGPIALVNSSDVPNIPPAFERLLVLLCRAFIRDYEEQDSTSEWLKVNGGGNEDGEMEKLIAKDGLDQPNLGQIRGGAVDDPTLRVNFWVGGVTSRV